eukprot:SAG11_NODE_5507_length_1542_cov_0.958420_3_plen_104_part_00
MSARDHSAVRTLLRARDLSHQRREAMERGARAAHLGESGPATSSAAASSATAGFGARIGATVVGTESAIGDNGDGGDGGDGGGDDSDDSDDEQYFLCVDHRKL